MSKRLRATPWFRSEIDEYRARLLRILRCMYLPNYVDPNWYQKWIYEQNKQITWRVPDNY